MTAPPIDAGRVYYLGLLTSRPVVEDTVVAFDEVQGEGYHRQSIAFEGSWPNIRTSEDVSFKGRAKVPIAFETVALFAEFRGGPLVGWFCDKHGLHIVGLK